MREIDARYRIERFAEQEIVDDQALIDFWAREGALAGEEAERRVREVLLVATSENGELVGVSSAYLQRSPRLRLDLWCYRLFVARAHRLSNVGFHMAMLDREHLRQRYLTGEDPRAAGIVWEVENEGVKRYLEEAVWLPYDATFLGENRRGAQVRVHYFPGAHAPEPLRPGA